MSPPTGSQSAQQSVHSAARIDRLCLDFEDAWQSGATPAISDFLDGWHGSERGLLLKELLLLEIEYQRRRGREPVAEEYLERFPEDRATIAALFEIEDASASLELTAGQRVGRYVIERLIGSGSFGRVYLAWDSGLERMVALKVPHLTDPGQTGRIDDFIEEARTASKIDHPAIVPVLDVVREATGPPAMVMPYIEGCSLRERMSGQRLELVDAINMLTEIADAMDFAHRRGFVHRDLKPRNILLDGSGRPHITDFGLALHESNQRSRAGESAGSLAYMSPEQLRGQANWLDGRSDIWALGVILYEMLTGRRPFDGRTADELASEIFARDAKPPRQIDATIPVELERICLTCLSKSISGRFATARDFADALRRAMPSIGPNSPPVAAPGATDERHSRPSKWKRNMMVAGGIALVAAWALLLAVAFGALGRFSQGASEPVFPDIELSVFAQDDEFRGRLNRVEHSASPLRTADKVRLGVTLSRPLFLYVLWIGTEGDVVPIYPWPAGTWDRPEVERATANLQLPVEADRTWQVQPGPAGVETIVVLTADRPWPAHLNLPALLQPTRPQIGLSLDEPLWFENGQLLSRYRSPNVIQPAKIENSIISNQLLILDKLKRYVTSMHAICFPLSGAEQ